MSLLKIRVIPDPVLRKVAAPVTTFDVTLHKLLDDMAETMYAAPGVGLAANQIGVLQRVIVVDITEEKSGLLELVNPEIIEKESPVIASEEGCLSIPEYRDSLDRFPKITVRAQNRNAEVFTFQAEDLLARCVQHEIDHLNGVLFVDHLSRLKREFFQKWLKKQEWFKSL